MANIKHRYPVDINDQTQLPTYVKISRKPEKLKPVNRKARRAIKSGRKKKGKV